MEESQRQAAGKPPVTFSIFFFSSDSEENIHDKYGSIMRITEYADEAGFEAVWTPERHFHRFGGLYPNPSVLSAALAARTKRIGIRAGSVLLPMHHPIRVAEDWSIIDNLSGGRAGLSVAPGWHANESVFIPEIPITARKEVMFERIGMLQRLWQGETVTFEVDGQERAISKIYPEPVQKRLPLWVTSARTKETWRRAAALGANVLTAMYGVDLAALKDNIAAYREEWAKHGHAWQGQVTAMLHTFVGQEMDEVRKTVKKPFINYLLSHTELHDISNIARELKMDPAQLTDKHRHAIASFGFERYVKNSSLIGTVESCSEMIDELAAMGVNEIACLVDFGVHPDDVIRSLEHVAGLQRVYAPAQTPVFP